MTIVVNNETYQNVPEFPVLDPTTMAVVERYTMSDGSRAWNVLAFENPKRPAAGWVARFDCLTRKHARDLCEAINACANVELAQTE